MTHEATKLHVTVEDAVVRPDRIERVMHATWQRADRRRSAKMRLGLALEIRPSAGGTQIDVKVAARAEGLLLALHMLGFNDTHNAEFMSRQVASARDAILDEVARLDSAG